MLRISGLVRSFDLNTWGDLARYPDFSRAETAAYQRCISDAMDALRAAGVGFGEVPDEAWSRWTGL
jgi:hypothetical protein